MQRRETHLLSGGDRSRGGSSRGDARRLAVDVSMVPGQVIQLAGGSIPTESALGAGCGGGRYAGDAAFGFIHALPADRSGGGYQHGIPRRGGRRCCS